MKKNFKILAFGFLIWVIPVMVTVLLPDNVSPAIDNVITIFVDCLEILIGFIFLVIYFMGINENYKREGFIVGLCWLIIGLGLDLIVMLPRGILWTEFATDAICLLFIFIMSIGMGYLLDRKTAIKP